MGRLTGLRLGGVPVRKDYWFFVGLSVKRGNWNQAFGKSEGEDYMLTDLLLVLLGVCLIPPAAVLIFFLVCLALGTLQILIGVVARLVRTACYTS